MSGGLKKPCPHCPFRTDIRPFLRRERCEEIADGLRRGGSFDCHETTEVGTGRPGGEKFCFGALLTMHRDDELDGGAWSNQIARMAANIMPDYVDGDAVESSDFEHVPAGLDEWIEVGSE